MKLLLLLSFFAVAYAQSSSGAAGGGGGGAVIIEDEPSPIQEDSLDGGGGGAVIPDEESELPNVVPSREAPPRTEIESIDTTGMTLRDIIVNHPELSDYRDFLDAIDLLEGDLDNQMLSSTHYTIFAPSNEALRASGHIALFNHGIQERPRPRWVGHMKATAYNHMVANETLTMAQLFDLKRTALTSLHDTLTVSQWNQKINRAGVIRGDLKALNGILHIVNAVVEPDYYDNSFARLELQPEYGPDW